MFTTVNTGHIAGRICVDLSDYKSPAVTDRSRVEIS